MALLTTASRDEHKAVEAQQRAGHLHIAGLCQALADWSAELKVFQEAR